MPNFHCVQAIIIFFFVISTNVEHSSSIFLFRSSLFFLLAWRNCEWQRQMHFVFLCFYHFNFSFLIFFIFYHGMGILFRLSEAHAYAWAIDYPMDMLWFWGKKATVFFECMCVVFKKVEKLYVVIWWNLIFFLKINIRKKINTKCSVDSVFHNLLVPHTRTFGVLIEK